ncbi:SRPBCC domain-containing protein [Streptomyces sp. NBC_00829]|uniref:SRPBCC domain-containing protein n=1 Tax=Streptomyces sp. NBC_00829 TaxID=2903679 RepID=UPI00386F63C3|nr:SRPBCC domain-containing protein [Streptomyces sp. NBC_00829]
MDATIRHGTSETRDGSIHLLRFALRLPHPAVRVWAAVATPEGLPTWLAAADVLEPHVGGAITLRWLNATDPVAAEGRVTAWDPERVVEYDLDTLHGRMRFHLEPADADATVVRLTHELRGTDELRLDTLAAWHDHFELLAAALDGQPMTDWSDWTPGRWQELREEYVSRP